MFTLTLSTEEIKTLQLILEDVVACETSPTHIHNLEKDLLTKILLVQMNVDPQKDTGKISFRNVPVF